MSRDKSASISHIWDTFEQTRRNFLQAYGEQTAIAERLGVDRRKINKWLKGRPKLPSLWNLADGLRFSIDRTVGHVTQDVEVLYTVRDMAYAIFSALDRVLPERTVKDGVAPRKSSRGHKSQSNSRRSKASAIRRSKEITDTTK